MQSLHHATKPWSPKVSLDNALNTNGSHVASAILFLEGDHAWCNARKLSPHISHGTKEWVVF